MTDKAEFRKDRIERLLYELRYEIERGMLERDIDETLMFKFYVPLSQRIPGGVVKCEFRTRPVPRFEVIGNDLEPKLRVIKGDKED